MYLTLLYIALSLGHLFYTAAMVTDCMCSMRWSVRKVIMLYSIASRKSIWKKLTALTPILEWMSENVDNTAL